MMTCQHHKSYDPPKGPVLLNYGIEKARKQVERQRNPALAGPVYPGAVIQVKFTVKEKVG